MLIKWLPNLLIITVFPLLCNYLQRVFRQFSEISILLEKKNAHSRILAEQLNKNYLIVKLASDKVNKRQIEMNVIEISSSIKANMPRLRLNHK